MKSAIKVESIVKTFGKTKALNRVSLSVPSGINIILGPNGAGKSTLLRCVDGLYRVDTGSVRVLGKDPYKNAAVRDRLSLLTDNYALYDFLTVADNLKFFGRLYGLRDEKTMHIANGILKELDAMQYINNRIYELSRGTKQKIAFCRAILNNPEVLLLDEPTAFLDAHSAEMVRCILLKYADEHKTILFVTQKLDEVTRFNGRVSIIKNGHIIKETTTEGLYNVVLKDTSVNVRLARPIALSAARRIESFAKANSENPTMLEFRVDNYRQINKIVGSLIDSGAHVVSVDYIEHLIDDLSR